MDDQPQDAPVRPNGDPLAPAAPRTEDSYMPPAGDPLAPGGFAPRLSAAPSSPPPSPNFDRGAGPAAPSDPPKRKMNWLMCCGLSFAGCLGTLLLFGALTWAFDGPLLMMGYNVNKVRTQLDETDLNVIKYKAVPVDSATLAAHPEQYRDKWLDLTAVLDNCQDDPLTYHTHEYVFIRDIADEPKVGQDGDTVHAYGMIVIQDSLWAMGYQPTGGPPGSLSHAGMPKRVVELMAKHVEVTAIAP